MLEIGSEQVCVCSFIIILLLLFLNPACEERRDGVIAIGGS